MTGVYFMHGADIDGVLVRGKIPLAAAQEAMQKV